jgi:Uma2 family endonuclease
MTRIYDSRRRMSIGDYFAWEQRNPSRHEYVAGEVHAMSGATVRHNLIALNLVRALHGPVRARGCVVLASDVQLRAAADRVYYPDVMLVCGGARHAEHGVEQPALVAEVTSPSTRATDRREKLEAYTRIPSLLTYLIVDQRRRHVLVYQRDEAQGEWLSHELVEPDDVITVPWIGGELPLHAIYDGVDLPPLTVREEDEEGWGAL